MITLAIASIVLTLAPQAQGHAVQCAVMHDAIPARATSLDYAGVRYPMCCASCVDPFKKDPAKYLKPDALKDKVVGVSLFDPTTGLRIEPKDAKGGFADFQGIRYHFATAEGKTAFAAAPARFAANPTNEMLYCSVMGHAIKDYASAGGYVDHAGTRMYVCCSGCMGKLKADPATHAEKAKAQVKKPAVLTAPRAAPGG
jgi:YHS domain-containing protein